MCNPPQTLVEAVRYFSDADRCLEHAVRLRWPNGVTCPHCESQNVGFLRSRKIWKCRRRSCRKQFSVKVGTIMEDSPLKLDKWLVAIWLIVNAKNGISSHELARALGVTQKSAWFMLHRIRLAMQSGTFEKKLIGDVEVDESYIGGAARNMHTDRRLRKMAHGVNGKTIVMGMLERKGDVRLKVVENASRRTLHRNVREHVEEGANLYTDELASYKGLSGEYAHKVINHAECYAKGEVHTNGLENFWSLLKRGLNGTYVAVEPFHLFRYLDEQAFRFNSRHRSDAERFGELVGQVNGRRLTYRKLIGAKKEPQ